VDDADLAERMARARAGDQGAVRALLERFEDDVRMVVRVKLPRALRSKFDSMDFVQSVWQDVFTREVLDPDRFENARHLLGYLAGVARNKVLEEQRRRTRTRKYDLGREEPLYVRRGDRDVPRDVAGTGPTPSQDVQARDRLAQILAGLSPRERQVVDLRRKGLTYADIAERMNMHEGAVRRIIDAIRQAQESRKWQ
jgi:RNA polymerase sigma factor (sigma-70 family)